MTEKLEVLAGEIAHWRGLRDAALDVAEHADGVARALARARWDGGAFRVPVDAVDERVRTEVAIDHLDRAVSQH